MLKGEIRVFIYQGSKSRTSAPDGFCCSRYKSFVLVVAVVVVDLVVKEEERVVHFSRR